MPKINVYLPDELAAAVKEAQVPESAICQSALERAVRDVQSVRAADQPPAEDRPGVGLFGRFTPRSRGAVSNAENAARDVPHNYVGTEHVLLGVLAERDAGPADHLGRQVRRDPATPRRHRRPPDRQRLVNGQTRSRIATPSPRATTSIRNTFVGMRRPTWAPTCPPITDPTAMRATT